nr:hypothetical protein [Tanacetum cinerariifolium]
MATTIEKQVALDEALVPSAQRSPFFKAFFVTTDVPEIYMQEFWATAKVHQHSIRFKMDTKKHIVDLESFREMLYISPRVPGQSFAELPFEEEILEFLRSFAAVINKCLTGKSSGIDSLSDGESEDEETREQEEESFDPIPRTPEDSEDDRNNEEDQGLRIGEEERIREEEEADELA